MAAPHPNNDYILGPFLIADISTGSSTSQKLPVPMRGQIVQIHVVQAAQTTDAAAIIAFRKNGTGIAGVGIGVPVGAAGDVNVQGISPNLITGFVDEGEELDCLSDGGSTGAGVATVFVVIRK